ncbi:MAG: hypothetical protein FWH37_01960 [Candidatus Bathyarchaeota archaeon]|nr:hypothetical protein [Candidatus Termiticorpusculum sp.]
MNPTDKTFTVLLIVLLVTNLLILSIVPANAQATSKPSVPQFTVKFVDYSYDVPSVTSNTIDQYTGEKITNITPGYHIENKTIEITIKNQHFIPYNDSKGINYYLYFFVQSKGYFGDEWQDWGSTVQSIDLYGGGFQSWIPSLYSQGSIVSRPANYATGAQVDFRVEARIGHYYLERPDSIFSLSIFTADATSGWSKVQTFTMPGASSPAPTQTIPPTNPTATTDTNYPQQPEQNQPPSFVFQPSFLLWVGALLFAGIAIAVIVMFTKKHLKPPNYNNPTHNQ